MAVLFCECSLRIVKSVFKFIDLCMQIADLPLHMLISINFDAVDECRLGALYSIWDVETL